jgi:hypothetical protein
MQKRLIVPATALAALISLFACPLAIRGAARTMSQWEVAVRAKLAGAAVVAHFLGGHLACAPVVGSLENNTYRNIVVTLHKGVTYGLIGVCDDDCRVLNTTLYDEDGELLFACTVRSPICDTYIKPAHTGDFVLRMIMKRCDADSCFYGLGIYSK